MHSLDSSDERPQHAMPDLGAAGTDGANEFPNFPATYRAKWQG